MQVLTTFVGLGILGVALVLLRLAWHRLPQWLHVTLTTCGGISIALILGGKATGWTLISMRLVSILLWFAVAGYGIFLIQFSLLFPRWLASAVAIVLYLPLLSSSLVLPLALMFSRSLEVTSAPLGNNLYSVRYIVDRKPVAPSAADLEIFYRPRWFPIIQHRKADVRFFDTQCLASASYAVLQPNHRSVLLACPGSASDPSGTYATGKIVPLH